MATTLTSVSKYFPKPQDGFTTTTSGSISSGATSVGLNSTGSYANGDVFVGIIDPTDSSKKQAFTGTVDTSGVQITGVVWTTGTNQNHSAGATVVDYVTATHLGMISKGILVEHNQSGTHAAITATSLTATGNVQSSAAVVTDTISEKTSANGVTIDGLSIKDSKLNTASSVNSEALSATVAFRAYNSAATTLTNNTSVQIAFATEVYDYGSNFASNQFTAPYNGVYNFSAAVSIDSAVSSPTDMYIAFYVDGALHSLGTRVTTGTDFGLNISADIPLTASQTVRVYFYQSSAGAEATKNNSTNTWFAGHLVGRTA